MNADLHGALRVGTGGPVDSGKTALVEALCKRFRSEYQLFVITNDIYTKEDQLILTRAQALPAERIIGVGTGGYSTLLLCLQRELGLRGMYKKRIDVPAELRA